MALRERAFDRGSRRGRQLVAGLGQELRAARRSAGLTQELVGRAAGTNGSYVGKIERGEAGSVSVPQYARLFSVVGLDLSVKAYPGGSPLRDAAHLALLGRLRTHLHPSRRWRAEVAMPSAGDMRAWDAEIRGARLRIGVEAETRTTDLQALLRRLALKARDRGVDRVVLLLAVTRTNRGFVREYRDVLAADYPVAGRVALAALADGHDPGGNALVML